MVLMSVMTPISVEVFDCNIVAVGADVDTDNSALVREADKVAKVTITAVLLVLNDDKTNNERFSRSTGIISSITVRCPYHVRTILQQSHSPS